MKIILAASLDEKEKLLNDIEGVEIIEECEDLEVLSVILEYNSVDIVILDRYFDETENGEKIRSLIKATRKMKKDIRFIILLGEYEEKFAANMVNLGVYDLVVENEIATDFKEILDNPRSEFDFSKYSKSKLDKGIKQNERIVYKIPKDYQKIIGIYSPYAAGKTVTAVNLAKFYESNDLNVTLIDTDFYKKDILYYFPLESSDYLKMLRLYRDTQSEKEIGDISKYEINISKRLRIFTDHRDSKYEINMKMINMIIRNSDSNVVIIDISKDLDNKLVNEIMALCDERIIVADKMISTLNGLPYKLNLTKSNRNNLSLVINRNVNLKNLPNRKIINHFKNITVLGKEKYNFELNDIFFIPNKFEVITEALANRDAAYGRDEDFDESIEKIGASMYMYSMNTPKRKNRGFLKGFKFLSK